MKGFIKKIIVFLLVAVVAFALAKCDEPSLEKETVDSEISTEDLHQGYISSDFSGSSYYTTSSRYSYSNGSAQQSETSIKTFYSAVNLRDYLNEQKKANNLKVSFNYKGKDGLEAETLAQMTNAFYVNYNVQGDLYTVTFTEYPGDRIVDAYFSGNKASLTYDEKTAMERALGILNTAKSKAKNSWELELEIHNILANSITYYDDTREFSDPKNAPRYLSIIGALLDGKANCQGYSDAFYTIASMAGFTVSRMSVETRDDLHQVNTILLNGSWYVVDVTFDDQDDKGPLNYRLFNAGLDQIHEFTWKPWKEINKISATSGRDYYYNYKENLFNNINSFVDYVVEKWLNGEKTVIAAIKNQSDGKTVEKSLKSAMDKTGKAYNYNYWYFDDTKDFYYKIDFK